MPSGHSETRVLPLETVRLGRDVVVLAWDAPRPAATPAPRRLEVARGRTVLRPPYARTDWPLAGGRQRNLLALRLADDAVAGAPLVVADGDGRIVASAVPFPSPAGFSSADACDAASLLADASPAGRVRLARFILELCAGLFGLGGDPAFTAVCRAILAELNPSPPPLLCRAAVLGDHVLCETTVPAALGDRIAATVIGSTVRRPAFAPLIAPFERRDACNTVYVLLERASITSAAHVVFIGEGGAAIRRLRAPGAALPTALGWVSAAPRQCEAARRYLIACLASLPAEDVEAAGLARALAVLGAAGPIRLGDPAAPLAAGFDLLLGCEAGLFLSGWLHDPHALVTGIEIDGASGAHRLALADLPRSPRPPRERIPAADGFVALLREPGQPRTWPARRLALRLAGGHRLPLPDVPTVLGPATARAAVIAALAGTGTDSRETGATEIDRRLLEDHLEPVLDALTGALGRGVDGAGPAEVVEIGCQPKHPAVSVILAPGQDDAILRCQLALLAIECPGVVAELLLVGRLGELEPARRASLAALVTAFGLGARLLVAADDACDSALLNAAAAQARAPLLQFLGCGAVPEAPGWLGRLAGFLGSHPECTIAGARLIEADHALHHAAAEISFADGGAWAVVPRFRGYPRDFLPAALSGPVPVVSRQCLITRQAFFSGSGGFSPAFLSATYADADLCLRARDADGVVWHLSEPTLFALATVAAGATESRLARLLDGRKLATRWRDRLRQPEPANRPAAASSPSADAPRRRRRCPKEAAA